MLRLWMLILLAVMGGCAADMQWAQRQPTQDDPPFGGGFESSRRPGGAGDPMDPNLRRTEIRPTRPANSGAPGTSVDQ